MFRFCIIKGKQVQTSSSSSIAAATKYSQLMSVCPDGRVRVKGGEEIWLAAWSESLMKIQQICTSISDPGAIHYSTSHVNRSELKFQYIGSDLYSRIKWLQIHNLARQKSGSRWSLSPSSGAEHCVSVKGVFWNYGEKGGGGFYTRVWSICAYFMF